MKNIRETRPTNIAAQKWYNFPASFDCNDDWNVWAELNDGRVFGCDLIIEATGVIPNSGIWSRDAGTQVGSFFNFYWIFGVFRSPL